MEIVRFRYPFSVHDSNTLTGEAEGEADWSGAEHSDKAKPRYVVHDSKYKINEYDGRPQS